MASIILRSVGAAVGNALVPGFGGALLGSLAGSAGGAIDAQLGLGATVAGPRLENLSVQDSRYGAGIPIVYGNARIAGNVIWSSDLIEAKHSQSVGGKGGGSVRSETYTYSVHCAVGICAGPIAGISTIWADSAVIYQNGVWSSGVCDDATIYMGDSSQQPDAFMQSVLGAGNVPAYRGLAYIVFDNLQLAKFGNRLPNLTFEISQSADTKDPQWNTETNTGISARGQSVQNGSMTPIKLSNGNILVGGYLASGGYAHFIAVEYDVSSSTPALYSSANSGDFVSASIPSDCAWAISPDGRFVAMYLQSSASPSHSFVIYDTQTKTFGNITGINLSTSSSACKKIAWIDALHFLIDDSEDGARGVRVFARAGSGIIDLGFTNLWGSGSATSTKLFYGAQYTPFADGLIAYSWQYITSTILNLQARSIIWRNGDLVLGGAFTVASGLPLGSASGGHARFVKTANGEWTLFYGSVQYYYAMTFTPSSSGAAIVRPWQKTTFDTGTGTSCIPIVWGNRILVLRGSSYVQNYLIDDVLLGSSAFSVSVTNAAVADSSANSPYFDAVKLDGSRLLFAGVSGSDYNMSQLATVERNSSGNVADAVSDILSRAGYDSGDFDVLVLENASLRGYVLSDPTSARRAIEPLQAYAPFDLVETDGKLKAVMRGQEASIVISATERRAAFDGEEQPPDIVTGRSQEMDFPREVAVDYIDPARRFEVNCQRARRMSSQAKATQKLSLPIVCAADKAKQIAQTRLYSAWAERELIRFSASRAFMGLDAGDVVDMGDGAALRIAKINQSGGLLQIEGFPSTPSSLVSSAVTDGEVLAVATNDAVPTSLYLMDLPLLQSADDQPGFYIAASGGAGWKGASVLRSSDGANYSQFATASSAAIVGYATTALGAGSAFYMDGANTVDVQLSSGELESRALADVLFGANAALLGDEIIQFQTATLIGAGLYRLSNLLRGRRGTEDAVSTHCVAERFVLLKTGSVDFIPANLSDRGRGYCFRALSDGQTLGDAQDYSFTYAMRTLRPLSPVNICAERGISGDLTLTWVRRARLNAQWVDYIDVPLDEASELYDAEIMNGDTVVRTFSGLPAPTVVYTAAQQTADWGASIPSAFTVRVYQISARYGRGGAGSAAV